MKEKRRDLIIQCVLAILLTIGAPAMNKAVSGRPWVSWLALILAFAIFPVAFLTGLIRRHREPLRSAWRGMWIPARVLPFGIAIGIAWAWVAPSVIPDSWTLGYPVRTAFDSVIVSNHLAGKLGKAVYFAQNVNQTTQSSFSHAVLIWLSYPNMMFALPLGNAHDSKYVSATDASRGEPWEIGDENEIRKHPPFNEYPVGCKLPRGGFLVQMIADPDQWNWIGCGNWMVVLDSATIFFQKFEHGSMFGPILVNKDDKTTAQFAVIYDNGTNQLIAAPSVSVPKIIQNVY